MINLLRAVLRLIRFYRSAVRRQLKSTDGQTRILLLNTPLHGNLGDAAIVLAERKLLTDCVSLPWVEITQNDYLYFRKYIHALIRPQDILALQGGGSIGTLWPQEQEVITEVLTLFSNHKIVIFPQTLYFSPDNEGKLVADTFCQAVSKCDDLTIFLRDDRSYTLAQELLRQTGVQLYLTPDIVTYLNSVSPSKKENQILLCFRQDLEGVVDQSFQENISAIAETLGAQVIITDTHISKELTVENRQSYVQEKLREFSKARLIITDRIHGMVFSAIAGTACIAIDNVSKKVSGAYQWISSLDYVKMADGVVTPEDMQTFYAMTDNTYSNDHLNSYYEQIAKVFQS